MSRTVLYGDVFGAGEIALEFDDFEVLHVQREDIGLLLVDYCELLPDFYAREELLHLLLVQLHLSIKFMGRKDSGQMGKREDRGSWLFVVAAEFLERWYVLAEVGDTLAG